VGSKTSAATALRVVPLGGLGEIGMNCLALEQGDDILVIDCGVTFPTGDVGVDVLHPRFDYLIERADRVRGLVITHGHEDHIGAVPYLLEALDVPVYAPEHAMGLIKLRLSEHELAEDELDLIVTQVRRPFEVGSFRVEPIRVTHSIADATALAIDTCVGTVIHTGDFKLDPQPTDGELTDEARLRELGERGVRLLFSDSTSIDSPGTSASEEVVGTELAEVVRGAEGRVILGLFASNVQRLLHVGRIAQETGRRICLLGRSMSTHVKVAHDVGRMRWPSDLTISPDEAEALPGGEVLVVATGTQAEPPAALTRLANGTHPRLKVRADDTVILSSRIIPGNDRAVMDMMAGFLRAGAKVRSRVTDPKIHTSGHAYREEQRRMLQLVRPRSFIPVHGTLHHLLRHAELARETGVEETLVIENGEIAELDEASPPRRAGKTRVGKVATWDGAPLADEVLRERAQLGRGGVATVAVVLDRTGELPAPPSITAMGVLGELDVDVLRSAEKAVARELAATSHDVRRRDDRVTEVARLAARRTIEAEIGQRPVVLVHVTRLDQGGGSR
jgi:ribonuclease J